MHVFRGSDTYVLDDELAEIVNISIRLEMPLLLKGEPGTGKTLLAHEIARSLQACLHVLNVKSSMKAVEALYRYDTLTRLNDSRFGDSRRDVSNIKDYIRMGKIGQAFTSDVRAVLLIDEIDKAESDFQDDLLDVLDQMTFDILEIDETVQARHRPIIIITSNAKRDLSDPFLGRCNFHHIAFPDKSMMQRIVRAHFPDLEQQLVDRAIELFFRIRGLEDVEKKPATRELINWLRALTLADVDAEQLRSRVPFLGVLVKKSNDLAVARQRLGVR
ncbi:MAG: MoxR family ATPase [Candidatus Schekmanbacteria bacterium]|nr:MoxR family ATPase [Candidatus Schekmanbacteria bacterium]